MAGSLAYTTAFALVPLAVVVLGVLAAFPVFAKLSDALVDYVFANFVPSSARAIEARLVSVKASITELTAAGTVAPVVSLLVTLHSVETTFNRIWRVASARPRLSRYLIYWTVLTWARCSRRPRCRCRRSSSRQGCSIGRAGSGWST